MAMTAATETSAVSASSLRALALSTLKSKRRKPAAVQPAVPGLSRPLPPVPTLDGMQLDYGEDESASAAGSWMDVDPPVVQDSHMREEGEISDEEGSSKRLSAKAAAELPPQQPPAAPEQPLPAPGGLSLLDRITDPPKVLPSMAESLKPLSERISSPPTASTSSRSIHTGQVRPNVPMDQLKYDLAKDLFLELLGWGVDPEYLVEAGLTRELIYYAFTELNLRLPNNLDMTGLLPYNPETVKSFSFIEPDPSSPASLKEPSPFPSDTPDTGKPSHGDQVAAVPAQGDLHDIEMLRRQELIARKAVQASRKAKKANTNPVVADVPSETVDDFLNSIMPAAAEVVPSSPHVPASPSPLAESSSERPTPSVSPPSPTLAEGKPNSTPPLEAPPLSTESVTLTFDSAMRLSPDSSSGDSTPTHQNPNRRGTKRPVASDFVDWDGSSRPVGRSNSYDVTPHPHHHHTRRKTGTTSFVSVPMRCVIDLSDSETDEDDETATRPTTSKVIFALPSNGAPTPNRFRPVPKSASSTGTTTPSTLEETEREIERMKQLIAERTRRQNLKKLAAAKAGTVNVNESAPLARETIAPVSSPAVAPASNSTSPMAPSSDVDDVGKASVQLLQGLNSSIETRLNTF
ncbi:hypothetical protein EST38_g1425 [Candolleomyces aberdarensis]|uniref:Uncharacterized protein n=1 Tax=Candolleomyces aberdarensis TaxID=2316362 RepID=A0A4Q2DV06_9AGAR|nr:hypothetical protein EST38_g1425 [Candolleomyces aberdarensis]